MKELVETIAAWRSDGADIGRAVVVRTFGSAPRPEGAVLLAAADGRIAGSVSGGCVEGAAFEEIQRARATGRSRVIRYGISDQQAWDVGLACGGVIDVLVEPSVPGGCRGRGAGGGASRSGRRPGRGHATSRRLTGARGGAASAGRGRGACPGARRVGGRTPRRFARRPVTRRRARPPGDGVADQRRLPNGRAGGQVAVHRSLPDPAEAHRRGRRPGRNPPRRDCPHPRLRDGRDRRPAGLRHSGAVPGRRPARRGVARRGRGFDRPRPVRRGGRAVARREVRRAGPPGRSRSRLPVRRRDRLAQESRRHAGAPARGRGSA